MKPFHVVHVDGPLYLSNKVWLERDLPTLRQYEIGAIVNLVEDHTYSLPPTIACLERGFPDGVHVSCEILRDIFGFIDEHQTGTNVLVHCAAGSSRSAAIVIGHLIRQNPGWTWDEAHRIVSARRSIWVSVEMRESVLAYLVAEARLPQASGLRELDARVLRELEAALGIELREISSIAWNTQGYVVENGCVVGLGIGDAGLTEFPRDALRFSRLRDLYLGKNRIAAVPAAIAQLGSLRYLHLAGNSIASLPDELGELGRLRVLNMSGNALQSLPATLGRLRSLEGLILHNNRIQQLPDEIADLANLMELTLDGNALEQLPAGIGRLTDLEYFSAASNRIESLPAGVGGLTNLRALNLGKNQLRSLPPEIGRLEMLDNLNVSSNNLESLPVEIASLVQLRRVNISLNHLGRLPAEIDAWLKGLQQNGAFVIREGWQEGRDLPTQSRQRADGPIASLPIIGCGEGAGGCGCHENATDDGAILVQSIDEIREPNRCGIANPSRAFRMLSRIVLDITYKCSLECPNCNRLCGVSPRAEELEVAAIRQFVDDSIEMNKKWAHIYLAGGEPSLHSDVEGVFAEVLRYMDFHKRQFGSKLLVKYFTNGYTPKAKRVLANLPEDFIVVDSNKTDSNTPFKPICVAPIDLGFYDDDNLLPCQESYQCGIALTHRGYYPCAVAAAIDDVLLNGDLGVPRLRDVTFERMAAILHETCRYCGHYFEPLGFRRESQLMLSATWQRFLRDGAKPERSCQTLS
jgi:Leucine-rich repeat (LRR) protein